MSRLIVNQIQGDAVSKEIEIPTGHKLNITDTAALVVPGAVLQTVSNSFGNNDNGTSTSFFDTSVNISLTTKRANSKVMYLGQLGLNCSTGKYMVVRLVRRIGGDSSTDTAIHEPNRISYAGTGGSGDLEAWNSFNYVDDPQQPAGTEIEYRIQIRNANVQSGSVRIGDNANSYVIIQEICT